MNKNKERVAVNVGFIASGLEIVTAAISLLAPENYMTAIRQNCGHVLLGNRANVGLRCRRRRRCGGAICVGIGIGVGLDRPNAIVVDGPVCCPVRGAVRLCCALPTGCCVGVLPLGGLGVNNLNVYSGLVLGRGRNGYEKREGECKTQRPHKAPRFYRIVAGYHSSPRQRPEVDRIGRRSYNFNVTHRLCTHRLRTSIIGTNACRYSHPLWPCPSPYPRRTGHQSGRGCGAVRATQDILLWHRAGRAQRFSCEHRKSCKRAENQLT